VSVHAVFVRAPGAVLPDGTGPLENAPVVGNPLPLDKL
jgi:hypothetical protein